jgi:hypothetical protein
LGVGEIPFLMNDDMEEIVKKTSSSVLLSQAPPLSAIAAAVQWSMLK